jgi:hypothetical protein
MIFEHRNRAAHNIIIGKDCCTPVKGMPKPCAVSAIFLLRFFYLFSAFFTFWFFDVMKTFPAIRTNAVFPFQNFMAHRTTHRI